MRGITNGQRLLVESGKSLGEIAAICSVSRPTVARWKRGESVPRDCHRIAMRDAYAIDVEAWDTPLPAGFEIKVPPRARSGPKRKKDRAAARPSAAPKPSISPRPEKSKSAPARVIPAYPAHPDKDASIVDNLRYSLACIRHDLEHRDLTTSARSKLRSDEARALGLIAKWQRDEELSEDRYVREHPAFAAHCDRVLAALKPCPDCLARVAKALRP